MKNEGVSSSGSLPWPAIVDRYRAHRDKGHDSALADALEGLEILATEIANGPLSSALFGWTSMFDLCIQQTDAGPASGPYLRVRPVSTGRVEFRYIDTAIHERQWYREVPPEAALPRFRTFLEQLHWIG